VPEIECGVCGRDFSSNEEYMRHYMQEHFHGIERSCPFCGEPTGDISGLEKHLAEEHNLVLELAEKPGEGVPLRRCSRCGEMIPFNKFNTHMKEKHPEAFEEIKRKRAEGRWRKPPEEEKTEEPAREAAETPEDIRAIIALEGREGLNRLKRRRLEEVLSRHPRITPKVRDYILFVWDTNEAVRDDANVLYGVLRDSGVEPAVAKSITDSVFSLEWKYAGILWEHGIEPRYPAIPQQRVTYPYLPQPYPQPPYPLYQPPSHFQPYSQQPYPAQPYPQPYAPYTPYAPPIQPQQQPLTREDVVSLVRSVIEEKSRRDRIEQLQQEIEKIRLAIEGLGSDIEMVKSGAIHAEEPAVAKRFEELQRELREMERKLYEQQREYESKLHMKELESIQKEHLKEIEILKKDLEAMNERFSEMRAALQEQAKAAVIGGFQSDAYRFLSQGMEKIAERKPLEMIARVIYPERFVGPPAPKGPTISSPQLGELQKRGLVE
jgi:uncharacterized C2H2 Zn-finger protein